MASPEGRLEQLERRVAADPDSVTFAALAEEYRRLGRLEEAVSACRAGLERYPSYVSARVTLGRALIELGDLDAARHELHQVLEAAPENLVAIRGLAEIHRLGALETEPGTADPALAPLERLLAAIEERRRAWKMGTGYISADRDAPEM